jgi:hypothetical protein
MFVNNAFLLSTLMLKDSYSTESGYHLQELSTRKVHSGLVVKGYHGGSLLLRTSKRGADLHLLLRHEQCIFGIKTIHAVRVRDVFSGPIVTYLREYYGKSLTNCSTFVEYLRTGVFVECDPERSSLMFSGGMNVYTGQKVRPGDTIGIFYYNRWGRSRKADSALRTHYRKCQRNVAGDLHSLKASHELGLTAEALLDLYRGGIFADYHFMFCIGTENGQPVFIQQLGRYDPKRSYEFGPAPIVVSVGMVSMSHEDVPACAFIKRQRE